MKIAVKKGTRLDQLLKYSGLCETGGRAKQVVQEGRVRVNGRAEKRRGYRLRDADLVEALGEEIEVEVVE